MIVHRVIATAAILLFAATAAAQPPAGPSKSPPSAAPPGAPPGAPPAAPAADARAAELYEEGLAKYNLQRYSEAIALWEQAYEISKAPLLLFNLGQAHRLRGDCKQALWFYAAYLRDAPNPENRAQVQETIALCRGAAPEEPPPARPVRPPSSPPEPPPSAVSGAPGAPTGADVELARRKRMAGIIAAGAGVALAAGGIVFAVKARSIAHDVEGYRGAWDTGAQDLDARGRRYDLIGTTMIGVGTAAMVGGGLLWWLGHRDPRLEPRPLALAGGAGLAIAGTF